MPLLLINAMTVKKVLGHEARGHCLKKGASKDLAYCQTDFLPKRDDYF